LPANNIINGLLTTTNLQIIIETITIVSQDLSKKIRSTIAGKQLRPTETVTEAPAKEISSVERLRLESKIDIDMEEDEDWHVEVKPPKPKTKSKLVKQEIVGTSKLISIDREIAEKECRFCEGYLIYLY
jgi:hypothetical protein